MGNGETFFLKDHTQNVGEKLDPDPFLKKENWPYLWINSLKFYTVCFCCMASSRLSKYIETKLQTTCFCLILRFFWKKKRGLELVSLRHFPHNFWRKMFLLLCSISWRDFIVWLLLLRGIFYNMYIAIVCTPRCNVIDFEVSLIFLIQLFFLLDQNVMTKT